MSVWGFIFFLTSLLLICMRCLLFVRHSWSNHGLFIFFVFLGPVPFVDFFEIFVFIPAVILILEIYFTTLLISGWSVPIFSMFSRIWYISLILFWSKFDWNSGIFFVTPFRVYTVIFYV